VDTIKKPEQSFTQTSEYRKWYERIKPTLPVAPKTIKELKKNTDPVTQFIAAII